MTPFGFPTIGCTAGLIHPVIVPAPACVAPAGPFRQSKAVRLVHGRANLGWVKDLTPTLRPKKNNNTYQEQEQEQEQEQHQQQQQQQQQQQLLLPLLLQLQLQQLLMWESRVQTTIHPVPEKWVRFLWGQEKCIWAVQHEGKRLFWLWHHLFLGFNSLLPDMSRLQATV